MSLSPSGSRIIVVSACSYVHAGSRLDDQAGEDEDWCWSKNHAVAGGKLWPLAGSTKPIRSLSLNWWWMSAASILPIFDRL